MKKENLGQLRFKLDGFDELGEGDELSPISPEEARQISEAARLAFEVRGGGIALEGAPEWMKEYLLLREMGWPWRVAAYIAWAASPKKTRKPKSVAELAEVLGLRSARAVYNWREKYPTIDGMVAVMQSAPLFEHRRDVIEALIESASLPDYKSFNDRKLFLEMCGLYTPKMQLEKSDKPKDLSELSEDELDALIGSGEAGKSKTGDEGDEE